MRGLRLRKENIQIGDDDALKKLFKEDRGSHYFVGEVFAVSKLLIPNSQRDYFNENNGRLVFEQRIRRYFNDELTRLYRDGSEINSAYDKINAYEKKVSEFQQKQESGDFIDDEHKQQAAQVVEKAKKDAEKAQSNIEKKKQKIEQDPTNPANRIISRIEEERKRHNDEEKRNAKAKNKKRGEGKSEKTDKAGRRVDKLTSVQNRDRKLISKIFSIIYASTDEETAEKIIKNIEDEFK